MSVGPAGAYLPLRVVVGKRDVVSLAGIFDVLYYPGEIRGSRYRKSE